MDKDKKKILAIVITAIISLLIAVAATLLGIRPEELTAIMPDISDIGGAAAIL